MPNPLPLINYKHISIIITILFLVSKKKILKITHFKILILIHQNSKKKLSFEIIKSKKMWSLFENWSFNDTRPSIVGTKHFKRSEIWSSSIFKNSYF